MNKAFIEEQINKFGLKNEPFLFLISYDFKKFYIKNLKNISNEIEYEINNQQLKINKKVGLKKTPISFEEYKRKFNEVQENIKKGNTYLLNLTSKTKIHSKLSLEEIYKNINSKFKLKVKLQNANFVCFSPEKFVEIEENKIYTYPMKGTINSHIKDAQNKILSNEKELAEHTMVVDLLRNDLSIIGANVKVDNFRYIDKINAGKKDLLQVSSKISASLSKDWLSLLGTIMISILPAGSITGTPKKKTVELLESIEDYDRDFYTGIFGVYDGTNFNSYVLIRFIEEINGELFYKSGGGITCDSDVDLEYEELLNKIYLPF